LIFSIWPILNLILLSKVQLDIKYLEVKENGIFLQIKFDYSLHSEEQPSLSLLFPSSHCYKFIIFPSPHTTLHLPFNNESYLFLHRTHSDLFVALHESHAWWLHTEVNGIEIFDEFIQDVTSVT
jgi:hypothetical protein